MAKLRIKVKDNTPEEIQRQIADAWLNICIDEKRLSNPLDWPEEYNDHPEKWITWLLMQPEYFAFLSEEIFNIRLLPLHSVIMQEMWKRKFPMFIGSRGAAKSFTLGLYSLFKLFLVPGHQVVVAGAAFRQSKIIFEYAERIWNNAPILRDICNATGKKNGSKHNPEGYTFHMNGGTISALPIGNGETIRGIRAGCLIVDEFNSVGREVFETVLSGFLAVTANPIMNVEEEASRKFARELQVYDETQTEVEKITNQLIISGTSGYKFQQFYKYFKDWHDIISSGGNELKLAEYCKRRSLETGQDESAILSGLNHKHYSIVRIPIELIPKGFMDEAQVARSKATQHSGVYQNEFGAVFSDDSNGFYKRSLIESCVASETNNIQLYGSLIRFTASLYGDRNKHYIMSVDPASEVDNFAICIIEIWPNHRRVVYCWTTNSKQHKQEIQSKLTDELDYYKYCAKKIRWLMRRFQITRIMIDSQGGGKAVTEALHDRGIALEDEQLIWPIIEEDKEKESDTQVGLHIIELVNFASADWTSDANHGLRKDMEDKVLLFPEFDPAILALGEVEDKLKSRIYDTIEDCLLEIEEMKNELSNIIITQTNSGRDNWSTPEIKLPGNKKGHMRKDRYSALLMANMGARQQYNALPPVQYDASGGFAGKSTQIQGTLFVGNEWFAKEASEYYDALE